MDLHGRRIKTLDDRRTAGKGRVHVAIFADARSVLTVGTSLLYASSENKLAAKLIRRVDKANPLIRDQRR